MTSLLQVAGAFLRQQVCLLQGLLFNPGSTFSTSSLFVALCIAIAFVFRARRRNRRDIRLKVLWRALFPRWMLTSRSSRADLGFLMLNGSLAGALLGGAILASAPLAAGVEAGLRAVFGTLPRAEIGEIPARVMVTVTLFLAYELAYWTNHYVSHRIPILWHFHRVHHTAEVLTPLTTFRVHPVDSIVFSNFLAVFTAVAAAASAYFLGRPAAELHIGQSNAIFVVFTFVVVHLQHSQFWIPARGWWGRMFVSPAHHQLHHSDELEHRDKNFGSCLAVWDWLFGTLCAPPRLRPPMRLGSGPPLPGNHTVRGTLIDPFVSAWRSIPFARLPVGMKLQR